MTRSVIAATYRCRPGVTCASSATLDNRCAFQTTSTLESRSEHRGITMNKKTFFCLISAMSLAASLASVAPPARADDDDRDQGFGNSRNHDHGGHHGRKSPQVVLISLDGAKPDFIQQFIEEGVLPRDG